MNKPRAFPWLCTIAAVVGCSPGPTSYELRIYGEAFTEQGIPASEVSDGWSIEFTEFVVAIGEVAIVSDVATDVPGWHVYDITEPSDGEGRLVTAFESMAEPQAVKFRIGRPDRVEGGNASDEQIARLQDRDEALHVRGVARRDGREIAFDWGMAMEYGHHCELGQAVSEPSEWGPTIFIHADHLLIDDLEHDPQTRFDLIASADSNGDDIVTPEELNAVTLLALERYQSGSRAIPDLWNYVGALTGTLGHIDGEGGCSPELVPRRHLGRANPYGHGEGASALYAEHCASCHGDDGGGDGPLAATGWPRASDLTRLAGATVADDYLYFRVSEGGAFFPYNSTMPRLADVLSEDEIWRVVTHVQTLAHGG